MDPDPDQQKKIYRFFSPKNVQFFKFPFKLNLDYLFRDKEIRNNCSFFNSSNLKEIVIFNSFDQCLGSGSVGSERFWLPESGSTKMTKI